MEIKLPSDVKMLIDRLRKSGYDCYAVGGCVRDSLRGLQPHDWDLTTSAQPDEIERIFAASTERMPTRVIPTRSAFQTGCATIWRGAIFP